MNKIEYSKLILYFLLCYSIKCIKNISFKLCTEYL